jgi:broad specificity phosphatase PhoE
MKSTLLTLILTGTLIGASGLAQAQEIQERKENQQDRIANGVANGSLTPHETANLEHKEAGMNKEIRHDRRQNGGNLTNKEKAKINRQQNKVSKDIYRDKHNAAHQ